MLAVSLNACMKNSLCFQIFHGQLIQTKGRRGKERIWLEGFSLLTVKAEYTTQGFLKTHCGNVTKGKISRLGN